jgi:hypothetical protein
MLAPASARSGRFLLERVVAYDGERDERAGAWSSPVSVAAQRNSLAPGILSAVRPLFFKSIQI